MSIGGQKENESKYIVSYLSSVYSRTYSDISRESYLVILFSLYRQKLSIGQNSEIGSLLLAGRINPNDSSTKKIDVAKEISGYMQELEDDSLELPMLESS